MITELQKAVNKEIRADLREEAMRILVLTTDENRNDFLEYHKKDEGNICCLVLDYAKMKLVDEGKMIQEPTDGFGKFMF